jgi:hypothetical protein
MTPQEIHEYKNRWMSNSSFSVAVNEDHDFDGKQWCKSNLKQHQWHFLKYTDMYEHTFCFEAEEDMNKFKQHFGY